jgi:hypothetical protein
MGWNIRYETTVEEMASTMKGTGPEKGSDRSGKEMCMKRMKKEKKTRKSKRKTLTMVFLSQPLAREDQLRKAHELFHYRFP